MPSGSSSLVVFSDLDGTLLDHHTYRYADALPALDALAAHDIPLVVATSKTAFEVDELMRELGLRHPSIVENGGAVRVPTGYFADPQDNGDHVLATAGYGEIRSVLESLRASHGFAFRGFADMSVTELAETTGLGLDAAARARDRATSEPIQWLDDDEALSRFTTELTSRGLQMRRGGRFLSIQSAVDKADGVNWLIERFTRAAGGRRPMTVALGDSANDLAMLDAVDIAVAMPAADGTRLEPEHAATLVRPEESGPRGFRFAIDRVLTMCAPQLRDTARR